MHLRAPSVDRGVQAFLWALVFFLVLWLGMLSIGIGHGTALPLSLVAAFFVFLFVRTTPVHRPRSDSARDDQP
jgi:hypothetical protein